METLRLQAAPLRRVSVALAACLSWSACTPDEAPLTAPLDPQNQSSSSSRANPSAPIPGQYIVVLKDEVQDVYGVARALAAKHGGNIRYVYTAALKGFALKIPDAAADALRRDPNVAYVEQDQEVHLTTGQPNTTWGLQRVSQRGTLPQGSNASDTTYTYTYFADGTGVTVYIIDSGIQIANADFGGRASVGYDAFGGNGIDCYGHGTHVSGTVGGSRWGIAKNAQLVAVRVFDCSGGGGTTSRVIAGVDWVTANRVLPAIANMSLEGPPSTSQTQAVENSIKNGYVTYVVSAGNDAANACNYSPEDAPDAIVVGATEIGDHFASAFSNFGSCVKINAPGVAVTSDGLNGQPSVMTGTSMAAPHVAGTAALYLSAPNTAASPSQVRSAILANASTGYVLDLPANTPNLIDYSAFIVSNPPTSVTAGGGVDTTVTCGPYGFAGTKVCGAIVAVVASGSNTIAVRYTDPQYGRRLTETFIFSGATASGGVDTTVTCGPYGFAGTKVCGAIIAVAASGSNTIAVRYTDPQYGRRLTRTLTLSGATASGGADTTVTCGPYGFAGTKVCGAIVGVVASGTNAITVRYTDPQYGHRHTSTLTLTQ